MPSDTADRRDWLRAWYQGRLRATADRYREELIAVYGPERGRQIEYAEAYEISEYAAPLDLTNRQRLFPVFAIGGAVTCNSSGLLDVSKTLSDQRHHLFFVGKLFGF